jgi:hypothetical protein
MLAEKDIDQTMAADWAAIREKYAEPEEGAPEPAEAVEQPQAAEAVPEPQEAPIERARDESGKFVKAPKEAKNGSRESPKTESGKTGTTPEGKPGTATPSASPEQSGDPDASQRAITGDAGRDTSRAPSTWKPTERLAWDKIPPEARAAIHRREADFMAGQSQLLPDAQLGKSMRQTIEPYRMLIEAEGGTPERAVADLLKTAAIFRVGTPQQKYGAIAQIAQQFGLDLSVFSQQQQPGHQSPPQPQQQFRDPRVDQILATQQQQEAERARREQFELETGVTQWINETDAQGQPLRPYVGDVINEMYALLPQIKQANPALTTAQALEEGYQRAIWAHPEIRTILQQKAASDLEAQRRAENQTRVREAKRAASVNVPRRASLPTPAKPGTLEETIAATARELGLIT